MSEAPDAAAVAAAAATAAAAAAAAATGDKPWYDGADTETVGFIQSKGWHDKPPAAAALEAVKSYREAQQFIGQSPDSIIKLPKDASDEAGWKAAYAKLGVPADAKDYDFSAVQQDGTPVTGAIVDYFREQAAALKLTKDGAVAYANAFLKHGSDKNAAEAAERTAKLEAEHKTLDANWGTNRAINLEIAKKGAEKLGFTPEDVNALEAAVGYAKTMEALRQFGTLTGEAAYIGGGLGPNKGGLMTNEQAVSRLAELKLDNAFQKRLFDGDSAANREFSSLCALVAAA